MSLEIENTPFIKQHDITHHTRSASAVPFELALILNELKVALEDKSAKDLSTEQKQQLHHILHDVSITDSEQLKTIAFLEQKEKELNGLCKCVRCGKVGNDVRVRDDKQMRCDNCEMQRVKGIRTEQDMVNLELNLLQSMFSGGKK